MEEKIDAAIVENEEAPRAGCPDTVTDEHAIALYEALCDEYTHQSGGMSTGAHQIICDIAVMEQTKRALYADIQKRGVMEYFKNGRQAFWRENKSIQSARALAEQQRKHLNELKLTPASQKFALGGDDDFSAF